jgi:hypothetical protein
LDVEALQKAGWSDSAVLDGILVIAYFAFVNRIAEGLGVELEDRTACDEARERRYRAGSPQFQGANPLDSTSWYRAYPAGSNIGELAKAANVILAATGI